MKKRLLPLLLCLLLLLSAGFPKASAAEVPYQTFTIDRWGNAAPAPNAYIPTRSIGGVQLGCGSFSGPQDLFYNEAQGKIYLVDSGNARIVVLSEEMAYLEEFSTFAQEDGGEYALTNPQGIFVQDDGTMYIADTGNQQVIVCGPEGTLRSILPAPESSLLPENFNYQPTKVVVDDAGRIYILSQGVYQGIIYLDPDGKFIKFFGPNDVEMTLMRQVLKIWKSILPDEAAASMQSFNPIEYSNLFLSKDGYLYATAAGSENGSKVVVKLNPVGINVDPFNYSGSWVFTDVTADENDIRTMLDTVHGGIAQLNESGNEMFYFGGIGDQVGLFHRAVSLIDVKGDLYVLDADKNTVTEFSLTQFGRLVHEATGLYNAGLYEESIEPWLEVVRHDANYLPAYDGLGLACYQLKDYDAAMYYFRLSNSRGNYSAAFREASLNAVRDSFSYLVAGIAALILLIVLLRRVFARVSPGELLERLRKKRDGKEVRHG